MSENRTVYATNMSVAERPDGTACINVSSRTGELKIEITYQIWAQLMETARWFDAQRQKAGEQR